MAIAASAYPRLSPDGTRVVAGDDVLVVDRTIELGPGIGGQWRDGESLRFGRQPDGAFMLWIEGHGAVTLFDHGFNVFVVADDRWIGWRAGEGLTWHDNVPWPGWHSPALSETRWAAILDIPPSKVLFAGTGDGKQGHAIAPSPERRARGIFARDPVLRAELLTWVEEDPQTHEVSVWAQQGHNGPITNITIPGNTRQGYVIPVEIDGERWALSHDEARAYLSPWDDPAHGYVIAVAPAHRPDARQLPNGPVRCVWDAEHNVLGEAVIDVRTKPRVDLRQQLDPGDEEWTSSAPIDTLPLFVGDVQHWPRTGSHDLHQTWDGRNLHLVKFGSAPNWERWVLDGETWYLREDRSQSGAGDYSMHPGVWSPRYATIGVWLEQQGNRLQRYDPGTCQVIDQHPLPYRTAIVKAWSRMTVGGDIGVVTGSPAAILFAYDPGGPDDTWEQYLFVRAWGLARWTVQDQRDPSKSHTTTFNVRGGQALTPTQGCWRRELVPWPPTPPDPKPEPKPEPKPKPMPPPEPVTMTTFRTSDGQHYLCAEGGGGREIVANRTNPDAWETFEVVRIDATHIALKASSGHFVCAEGGGGRELVANREAIGAWETFEVVPADGGIALRTSGGQFVCAENGGGGVVVANRAAAGAWETFATSGSLVGGGHVGGEPIRGPVLGYLPPAGQMRMEGWAMADDHGQRPMLSVTLMDGITQFARDRARLDRNIAYCLAHGVDFVRILGEVDWPGAERIPRLVDRCVEFTRYVFGHGMRVQLTIFGSHSHIDDGEARAYTEGVSRALRDAGLEIALALVEIINEPGGARWGVDRMRRHAEIVRRYLPTVPLALGAPYQDGAATTTGWHENEEGARAYLRFGEPPANILTPHFDRGVNGTEGQYRICRQPYIAAILGRPFGNNEGAGPGASAQGHDTMRDPTIQRIHANGTWLQKGAFHCWHTNAGVGLNTDSLLESEPGLPGLSAVRAILPGDIANFQIHNWHWASNPVQSLRGVRDGNASAPVRTHGLVNGGRVVIHVLGNDHGAELRARHAMRLTRYSWDGTQYAAVEEFDIAAGRDFFAPPAPDQIYVGRFM